MLNYLNFHKKYKRVNYSMPIFVHDILSKSVQNTPNNTALVLKSTQLSYQSLHEQIKQVAAGFSALEIERYDRVGIYLPKTFATVTSIFACSEIGAVFVPVNPALKAAQVQHIINDCDIKILVTNKGRISSLLPILPTLPSLRYIIVTDATTAEEIINDRTIYSWDTFLSKSSNVIRSCPKTASDIAAILYTSGSTGKPKGVVLSHENIVLGAKSVSTYLHNDANDKILAVLPLSFDYGLSQITTSLLVGATCVLLDYFLPNDVIKAIEQNEITGLAAVPPLWSQLCKLKWPAKASNSIRYFTNSGGALSATSLAQLRVLMPQALPYLMYGLTEAFRSTYLEPSEIDNRKGSMGKAIPNAEILIVRKDGTECDVNEVGELVHKGPLVSLGYWNDLEKTEERFKPAPLQPNGIVTTELAVWSGDSVKKDDSGYLYFVSRLDEMIKTSGYRVSPMEVEEILYQHPAISEAVSFGVKHNELGQAIMAIVSTNGHHNDDEDFMVTEKSILKHCQKLLANFMVPKKIIVQTELPHNANGKLDRSKLHQQYQTYFME